MVRQQEGRERSRDKERKEVRVAEKRKRDVTERKRIMLGGRSGRERESTRKKLEGEVMEEKGISVKVRWRRQGM